jgi:hypothetical protein
MKDGPRVPALETFFFPDMGMERRSSTELNLEERLLA